MRAKRQQNVSKTSAIYLGYSVLLFICLRLNKRLEFKLGEPGRGHRTSERRLETSGLWSVAQHTSTAIYLIIIGTSGNSF